MRLVTVARALRTLALGSWFGGALMLFLSARYIFALEPDRGRAADITGAILHTAGIAKLALGAVALAAEFFIRHVTTPRPRFRIGFYALIAACLLAVSTAFYLEPRMLELRAQIGAFTEATKELPERLLFGKLHGVSMAMATLETVLVGIALVCAAL